MPLKTPTSARVPATDLVSRIAAVDACADRPGPIDTLMLNVGLRCDLACAHCHHACSPTRAEVMSREILSGALRLAKTLEPSLVDVTGGEPVLYPHLRELIALANEAGLRLRVRTNLVALARPEAADLPGLFAEGGVEILASLPGVSASEVGAQRGSATWKSSLAVLRELAALGYGTGDADCVDGGIGPLALDIAYNPPLGELPRSEAELDAQFHSALEPLGVRFDRLLAIANVPVGRCRDRLRAHGELAAYMSRLAEAFNAQVVAELACRRSLEVAWDGTLWDCDFNLGAGLRPAAGPRTLGQALAHPTALRERRIGFGPHCLACTAGAGSS